MAFDHIQNGDDATPDQYNLVMDALANLFGNAAGRGGTVGSTVFKPRFACGKFTGTPGGSGNFNISYVDADGNGITFDGSPSVTVSGSGGRPNCLVTVSESQPGPSAFTVHCQDVTTGEPLTNGQVTVNWQAMYLGDFT